MFESTKKGLARKLDALESTEAGNGGNTIEYVATIVVAVVVVSVLFVIMGQMKGFMETTSTNLGDLFNKLTAAQG